MLHSITRNHIEKYGFIWVFGLYLVLPFLAFPEIVFGEQTLYLSDLSWIHYPRHIFAAEEWLAGRIPLWDPYQHNGLPFLAETQVGALYPFSAIFLSPLAPRLELSLFILIHFTLAATFTFMLGRLLQLRTAPAAVAGLAFGCGGFLMAQVPNLNIMTGAVWLPLILFGLIKTDRDRSWFTALLAGLPLAFQIFTAQPQIVFYSLITAGGYGLYRIAADFFGTTSPHKQEAAYAGQTLLLVATAIGSGLILAAPQWLSTLELQQLSTRSAEKGFAFLTNNSWPPVMGLNLLIPSAFGNNVTGFRGGDPFQEDFIYVGFMPLLLVFFSLAQRSRRDMLFFPLLLVAGLLLAFGRYTPLYQYVIQYLPGFALFRIPSRWLMVVNLALALLAGYGLQTLLDRGLSRTKFFAVATASLAVLLVVGVVWLFGAELAAWSAQSSQLLSKESQRLFSAFVQKGYTIHPDYDDRLLLGVLPWLAAPVFLLVTNIVLALGLFGLFAAKRISGNVFSLVLIGVLSLDLIAAGGTTINPTKPADWWQRLSGGAAYVLDKVGPARVFPLGMGSERATVSHLGQYFPSVYQVRSAGGHGSSLMLARTASFLGKAHPVQAVRVLGVRYLLTEGQMGADAASAFPIAYSDDSSYVYENPDPLPRTFVVHDALRVETPAEALAIFEDNAIDPAQTVVIESGSPLPQPVQPAAASTARIVAEHPQRVEIAVEAGADGYLVLLDTFYPGWVAHLDGQATPLYRANYLSRAVFVPHGQHTVVFEYRPRPFAIGLGLALGMVALIVVTFIATRQRERKVV